ncbi:unannotated protein [freshwater metagenome]|uniref:Unannotated protein n=1 Tax=freshwater metagenome TaxID=449393 RepID=A0A6J6JCQ8_9ZZZZ
MDITLHGSASDLTEVCCFVHEVAEALTWSALSAHYARDCDRPSLGHSSTDLIICSMTLLKTARSAESMRPIISVE